MGERVDGLNGLSMSSSLPVKIEKREREREESNFC